MEEQVMQLPRAAMLPDDKRLHLQHGPIDLIIGAEGAPAEVKAAYTAARARFATVLDELVAELPLLRREMTAGGLGLKGDIAQRMVAAVRPFWRKRVTPMAAVAGAVADEILRCMLNSAQLRRAYVNNGGDIALHLSGRETYTVASPSGPIMLTAEDDIRGIATSGWRGRSFSLGVADAVTVLAASAAVADTAATLIANHVDLPGSHKVTRQRADALQPDSDLRDRLVTVAVATLNDGEIAQALSAGLRFAKATQSKGLIVDASLRLSGQVCALRQAGASMPYQFEREALVHA
jgi:ApbE superfamily uncharacterized protein (UPF0280 family)